MSFGSYGLFSVLAFLVTCGVLFTVFSSSDDDVRPMPLPLDRVPAPKECQVLIVGGGVGGLYTAYHLSKVLGNKLCLVDDRVMPGGKVQSVAVPSSKTIMAPTCAEQMRDVDVQLRCLCRDLNVSVFVRGEVSLYYHNYTQFSGPAQFENSEDDAGVKYVVHNGPQQVLLKMFDVAVKNGMRVFMKERIESLDRHGGGGGFLLESDVGRQFVAEYLVWATPPGAFDLYVKKGKLAQDLRNTAEMRSVVRARAASILNLYMENPFWHALPWKEDRWSNFSVDRRYMSFTLDYGPTLQFVATPDRIETNMLRLFYTHRQARFVKELYRRSGINGVVDQALKQLRRLPDLANVEMNVSSAFFHHERFAYARLDPAFGVSKSQVSLWATQPVDRMCFASEGFSIDHSGWMGGAVEAATHCFYSEGPLSNFIPLETLLRTWSDGCLTERTCIQECFMLNNELSMKDIATGGKFKEWCSKNR